MQVKKLTLHLYREYFSNKAQNINNKIPKKNIIPMKKSKNSNKEGKKATNIFNQSNLDISKFN